MRIVRSRNLLLTTLAAAGLLAAQGQPPLAQRIAARLRANDLKADVSFLASDALQGRATPSPGLDMAAEYIAAQFRRAGLEPVGDEGYFQNASYQSVRPNAEGLAFTLYTAKGAAQAGEGSVAIQEGVATGGGGMAGLQAQPRILTRAARREPAMIVMVRAAAQQTNPNARVAMRDATAPTPKVPVLNAWDKAIRDTVAAAKPGPMEATVSAHVAAPIVQAVKLRNVAGVLRGTDPLLKDTYIIVTGHYDHLGVRPNAQGDGIYNGANDDASGTASVIAVAGALIPR